MKIKICGMREPDNIRQVTDLHPDYMGFIFWSGSPRNACQLDPAALATVPQTIRRVGVFVNETEEQVIRTVQRYWLDLVQLHGHESPETCRRINRIVPVIKGSDVSELGLFCCSVGRLRAAGLLAENRDVNHHAGSFGAAEIHLGTTVKANHEPVFGFSGE